MFALPFVEVTVPEFRYEISAFTTFALFCHTLG